MIITIMQSIAKRIIASLMLVVACLPFIVSVYFVLQQQIIHLRVTKQLKECALQTVFVPKKNITWVNQGKEILIGGKLFDVTCSIQTGDYLKVTGLYDNKEDELNKQIKNSEQDKSPLNAGDGLFSFLFQALFAAPGSEMMSKNMYLTFNDYTFSNTENLYSIYRNITSPPPKGEQLVPFFYRTRG
ncbi:MAG: hypothetical protein ABJA57_12300 [Ginsengibacter sp.]